MVESLIDILAQRAGESPDREAFGFQELSVSYRQLWSGVRGYAGWLRAAGVQRNDTLLVALPNSPNFFEVFYGLQLAGGIPVPLFPGSGPGRLLDLAKRVGARRAVVSAGSFESIAAACPGMEILPDRVPEGHEVLDDILFERPTGEDLAFIQFTSGSSGAPKGVQITHSGLLTNLRQMIERMGFTERDIFVSWLPVYHDMGLILMTMAPFYLGCRLYLMPTSLMGLRDWIRAMAEVRATFTAAPDFAYRLATAYVPNPRSYDLRSLRAALSGAEQVRYSTVRDFEAAFGLENVVTAGYGLAEATVGVCMTPPGKSLRQDLRGLVSVGPPLEGIDLAILRADGQLAETEEIGEVLVRSLANSPGYYDDPVASAKLFWGEGYLHTGDLGYLGEGGELFILARQKNMIKQAGRTIAPQEIEELVDRHPQIRLSAAIGVDSGGAEGEQAYVFAELHRRRDPGPDACHEIVIELVEAIHGHLGFRPGRVILVHPGAIPRTTNGKLQLARLREEYLAGAMTGQIVYP